MLHKLRARMQDEKGFTLIELLVVILIIGILAAIALPAFLNQREKAQDSEAKSDARTAQTAMETFYTDNQTYDGAGTVAELVEIEPALGRSPTRIAVTARRPRRYTVAVDVQGRQPAHVCTIDATPTAPCPVPAPGRQGRLPGHRLLVVSSAHS